MTETKESDPFGSSAGIVMQGQVPEVLHGPFPEVLRPLAAMSVHLSHLSHQAGIR